MNKRESVKSRRNRDQKRQRVILMIVIALGAILVAAAFIYPFFKPAPKTNPRPMADGTSMGDPKAPVKVEEFSDFQCPYCRIFTEEMEPKIVTDYVVTGKVHFTYLPYAFIGPESVATAQASYCAADQNKFWEYHDLLFANQAAENGGTFSDSKIKSLARDLKLDTAAFNACYDSKKYEKNVADNVNYGTEKGVKGTPYFLINGDKLVDATQLDAAIKEALSASPQ